MIKRIIIAIMLLPLVSILGCEEITRLTQEPIQMSTPPKLKILKSVELGSEWEMKQISFGIGADDEVAILLKLSEGDKVDGYFYLEKGDSIEFSITGKTLVDKSEVQDRFSFVASQAQGDTYTLTFHNPADDDDQPAMVAVFLEVIYPVDGSIYVPVEGK
ncbi:hypothetical protein ACFLW4_07280 [Chloroflexota bacterium]